MLTKKIAGKNISLVEGVNYIASRPMADGGRKTFPVTIREMDGASQITFHNLSYDEANELLSEFNNDPRGSFFGRIWS